MTKDKRVSLNSVQFSFKPEELPFNVRLKRFLYNPETHEYFGRTPISWGEYLFSILIFMFPISICVFSEISLQCTCVTPLRNERGRRGRGCCKQRLNSTTSYECVAVFHAFSSILLLASLFTNFRSYSSMLQC